jgi:hypothetical protein
MPNDPRELPRPGHRVLIELKGTKKRYALDVRMSELPEEPAEVVEITPKEPE